MLNSKMVKNFVKVALAVSVIGLSFGCEKSPEQNNPQTTSNSSKKVEFNVNVTSGNQKGKTLNGFYVYAPETFELAEFNFQGFDNKNISEPCKNLKVDKENGLGLHGTCKTGETIYTFGDDAPGRGHIVYPFGYSVEAEKESDGVGVIEYNNAT
ncbi:MAG: hypothetical protein KI793_35150 [Rivularia sp. (in: Bacteria)]|nr:hypothetical protein [Rivularia sp. MS3]